MFLSVLTINMFYHGQSVISHVKMITHTCSSGLVWVLALRNDVCMCDFKFLHPLQILVVWNNVDVPPPPGLLLLCPHYGQIDFSSSQESQLKSN